MKAGLAHQIGHHIAHVALAVQLKVVNRHRVEPFDAVVLVQHHHAIGHGFAGIDEALQRAAEFFLRHGLLAALPVQRRKHILPTAHAFRGALGRGVVQPGQQLVQVIQMKAQANQRRQQRQRQADSPAKQQRRQRRCRANAGQPVQTTKQKGTHAHPYAKQKRIMPEFCLAGGVGERRRRMSRGPQNPAQHARKVW